MTKEQQVNFYKFVLNFRREACGVSIDQQAPYDMCNDAMLAVTGKTATWGLVNRAIFLLTNNPRKRAWDEKQKYCIALIQKNKNATNKQIIAELKSKFKQGTKEATIENIRSRIANQPSNLIASEEMIEAIEGKITRESIRFDKYFETKPSVRKGQMGPINIDLNKLKKKPNDLKSPKP